LALDPDNPKAVLTLGQIAVARGRWEEAEAHFARAAASPDPAVSRPAHSGHAAALIQRGDLAAAEAELRERVRDDPTVDDLYHLGLALERQGRLAQAEQTYRRVLKLAPNHTLALNNAGNCALKQGAVDRARAAFEAAAASDPRHAESRYNLGLLAEDDPTRADALFREAASLSPTFVEPRFALARHAAAAGQLDEAERWASEVVGLAPTHAPAWLLRARIAAAGGEDARAREYLARGRALDAAAADQVLAGDPRLRDAVDRGSAQ
jgi:Tfp pilus assembly protein PilF